MSKDFNDKSDSSKTNNRKPVPYLKLVVSNPAPVIKKKVSLLKPHRPTEGFSVKVHDKGGQVYEMAVQDPSHYLECDLKLEVIEKPDDYGIGVICHFGNIDDDAFNEFVRWDETLYGTLMMQFLMKIMEQLLLFCGDHNASGLVIYVDDDQAKHLGIYESILSHQDQVLLRDIGEKTVLVIPADCKTFDKWVDFMEDTDRQLQQGLWAEQRLNPFVRAYLKSSALLTFQR